MDQIESRNAHSPEPASDDVASSPNLTPAEERAYWRGVADGIARSGGAVPADVAARATAPGSEAAGSAEAAPGEVEPPEETGRRRHDAFTGARKQLYLKALAKHGCILDACRVTGVSSSTVFNHQASDPDFERNCRLALSMAATPIELTAYERATVGHEEPVIRGDKVVGTRIRRSDYMLRILLQGSDPKKYGPRPGFKRKRLLKFERKQIEREVRAELEEQPMAFEEAIAQLDQALDHFGKRNDDRRREQGWTELSRQVWVPPGWVWTGEGDPVEAVARLNGKDDAVCNSSSSSTSQAASLPLPEEEEDGPNLSPSPGIS